MRFSAPVDPAPREEARVTRERNDPRLGPGRELPARHVEEATQRPPSADRMAEHEPTDRERLSHHLPKLPHAG